MQKVLLGIDAGTTSIKVDIFTLKGKTLASSMRTLDCDRLSNGGVEQDMNLIWAETSSCISEAIQSCNGIEVAAIGVTGQGDGAWLVDSFGVPTGKAAIWLDARAGCVLDRYKMNGLDWEISKATGSSLFPGTLPVILEYFRENNDSRLVNARWHLNCKDFISFKLTSVIATDPSDASRTYLDISTGQYSEKLVSQLKHEEFFEFLPKILPGDSIRGYITEEASKICGLPMGIPVLVGAVDTSVAPIALGLTKPGSVFMIIGTTSVVGTLQANTLVTPKEGLFTLVGGLLPLTTVTVAPMNGAPNIDWILKRTKLDIQDLDDILRSSPAGANGVMYHPYLATSGERAPFSDRYASASFFGISIAHTDNDLVRAVAEGVAISLVECLTGLPVVTEIHLAGGVSKSNEWCQLLADISGKVVVRPIDRESGTFAVAAFAGLAVGVIDDMDKFLQVERQNFMPNSDVCEFYDSRIELFGRLRDAVQPLWKSLHLETLEKNV